MEKNRKNKYTEEDVVKPKSQKRNNICIIEGCCLSFKTQNGLKKHLLEYDHTFYGMTEYKQALSKSEKIQNIPKVKSKNTSRRTSLDNHKDSIPIKDLLTSKNNLISNIFKSIFPNGVLEVRSVSDNEGSLFCKIPGCGKAFKSLLAYRYHCNTFLHSIRSTLVEYENRFNITIDIGETKEMLLEMNKKNTTLEISGITHHYYVSPDNYNLIKFAILDISYKRKRKGSVNNLLHSSEYLDFGEFIPSADDKDNKHRNERADKTMIKSSKYQVYNIDGYITASASSLTPTCSTVFVGTIDHYVPAKMFIFNKEKSHLRVYDKSVGLTDTVDFDCGRLRKIMVVSDTVGFNLYVLFNDGVIRDLFYNNNNLERCVEIECKNIIDFCYGHTMNIVLATDGIKLYKYQNNKLIFASTEFRSPIISIVIRDYSVEKEREFLEKNEQEKTPNFFYLDTNGHVTGCNSEFREEITVFKSTGLTKLFYLQDIDTLFLVDSFEYVTRSIHLKDLKTTKVLAKNAVTNITYESRTLYIGGFDGCAYQISLKRRNLKANPFLYLKLVDQSPVVVANKKEIEQCIKDGIVFDCMTTIVGLYVYQDCVITIYRNGYVVISRK